MKGIKPAENRASEIGAPNLRLRPLALPCRSRSRRRNPPFFSSSPSPPTATATATVKNRPVVPWLDRLVQQIKNLRDGTGLGSINPTRNYGNNKLARFGFFLPVLFFFFRLVIACLLRRGWTLVWLFPGRGWVTTYLSP
ncbi:hypothetical protein BO70DRAFT_152299 [Aspergillus heteromorphus CBS 117.55]|uniref:Uncharacterized protein n=1 Tax=Aspergillus heteromorphus CBS 117.55 TaxID=1448321 RepID=A0A317V334_9EURO|nr:uncharacterized protein BO70DRAFT_152299 [Aspergillus heteromorphus CBS 117.55]PWY68673.1 hypothetical protein BO70DRAFT_152299 [Aspergillus heteromorphus CBS 117.55]